MSLIFSAVKLYTAGDITESPCGGWDIEILDPNKEFVCFCMKMQVVRTGARTPKSCCANKPTSCLTTSIALKE